MTRANLVKAIIVVAASGILALIVAAPLVGAKNSTQQANQRGTQQDAQRQNDNLITDPGDSTNPGDPTTPSPSDPGFQWASISTNNGTPAVRDASDSSTSVASNTGTPGAYKVTFPTDVHVLGCTATSNSGTQADPQGPISCGLGDDTGGKPNEVQVLTPSGTSNPTQGSNFTVVAYEAPSPSG
jgi:type II secretory pathway pseudopilin PulG